MGFLTFVLPARAFRSPRTFAAHLVARSARSRRDAWPVRHRDTRPTARRLRPIEMLYPQADLLVLRGSSRRKQVRAKIERALHLRL